MIKEVVKKQQGLSVVELMVALSLLGVILALGYMFFSFGSNSFNRGEKQAIAQQGVRLTSTFITGELRYALKLDIVSVSAIPSSGDGFRYIYLDEGSIIYINENGEDRVIANSIDDGFDYNLIFITNKTDPTDIPTDYLSLIPSEFPDDLVVFIIDADSGYYTLSTSVQALNIDLFSNVISVSSGAINAVRYQKPVN